MADITRSLTDLEADLARLKEISKPSQSAILYAQHLHEKYGKPARVALKELETEIRELEILSRPKDDVIAYVASLTRKYGMSLEALKDLMGDDG
jgi:hypothetical protein